MGTLVNWKGTEEQRFWLKVKIADNGCWEWQRSITKKGYGRFRLASPAPNVSAKLVHAHRWAYEKYIAKIPPGLMPDHLCRNRRCINPLHLEPVTSRENSIRGVGPAAINARKQFCIRGHNAWKLRLSKNGTVMRQCTICAKAYWRARTIALRNARS